MKRNRTRSIIFVGLILARAAIFAGVNVTNIGPEGGTFRSLVVDPQDSRTLYAGARTAGVFKSIDGGATWTYAGLSGFTVTSLAVDPQDSNTIYAATVFENADDFRSFGIFKSQDGGENWSAVNSGLPAECLPTFAPTIDPQYPSTLYALTSCAGVFKSANGGENWYAVNSGLPDREPGTAAGVAGFGPLLIDPQNPKILYLGNYRCGRYQPSDCDSRLFKSTDGGESWNATSAPFAGYLLVSLAIDPQNTRTLYAGGWGGVFRSTDGGISWTRITMPIPPIRPVFYIEFFILLAIDPHEPGTIYAKGPAQTASDQLYKTTDGGLSWSEIGRPPYASVLTIDPRNSSTIYAAGAGVSRSTDAGMSWKEVNSGLRASPVLSVAIDPESSGALLYAWSNAGFVGVHGGIYRSTDGGASWKAADSGLPEYCLNCDGDIGAVKTIVVDPQNPATLYAGTLGSGVFKTIDESANWSPANSGLGRTYIPALAIDPQHPETIYAGTWGSGIFKTTDGGQGWTAANFGLPITPQGNSYRVTALAIDPNDTNTVYAGGYGGVFKSIDAGASWYALKAGLPDQGSVSTLAVDPQDPSQVYAAAFGTVFKSADGGASWMPTNLGLPTTVSVLAIDPRNPNTIYVGTLGSGAFESRDGGTSWMPVPRTPNVISVMAVDPRNPNVVYAGGSGGLFAITFAPDLNPALEQ